MATRLSYDFIHERPTMPHLENHYFTLYHNGDPLASGSSYDVLLAFTKANRHEPPPKDDFYHYSRITDINMGKYDTSPDEWVIYEE